MIDKHEIKQKIAGLFPELLAIRRHLHQNPELSYHETKTAQYLSELLESWNIPYQTGVGGNGIVMLINGRNPDKKVIALRADMDALPINEENNTPYRSLNQGVMHACGHDVHMTCLLGTAKILNTLKSSFEGSVKFIFQPAEEVLPGGAEQMIKAGVLKDPAPQAIIAQHVFPELKAGKVGFRSGMYMASSDEINLYIRGKGGHGAMPDKGNDTVLAAAQVLIALQSITSRFAPPAIPTVLTFGKITGNGAHNVFPTEVAVHGTFRTFDEKWRQRAHLLIKKIAEQTAAAFNIRCEVVIQQGYPAVFNHDKTTATARKAATDYLGEENVVDLEIRMTAEDFGRYAQLIPGCFYRLGVSNPQKNIISNLHTPNFDVDEKSIETGTGVMTWIALNQLKD